MKNSEYILYLDMDEVVSDFNGGYEARYNELQDGELGWTEFFATLEWTAHGPKLWRAVSKMFSDIRTLSTSNADGEEHEEVALGKRMWVKRNLKTIPEDHMYVVERSRFKALYANEKSILVDDLEGTISAWEANGGIGVLHNDAYVERTIAELERIINPSKLSEIVKRFRK
jgi:hypothetical protein